MDFLRAASIGFVVLGHWLIAAPWMHEGTLQLDHMMNRAPWTRWLSWLFQVMPIFFIVGGYSNSASWSAALRNGHSYGHWFASRLRRLIGPVIPLLIFWTLLAVTAHQSGVHPEMIRVGSQIALVPTWFLAVYLGVVMLVPWTHRAWERFGLGSFWALALLAVVVDAVAFAGGISTPRWTNYAWIWLAVHQLGYGWRSGRFGEPRRTLPWAVGGALVLVGLVRIAGYPVAMVGVPGEEVSNSLPPTVALLALGCTQMGLLLSLEPVARRWLGRRGAWAATILVNATIMTVYLWHVTVLALLIGLARLLGGIGLQFVPGSGGWWLSRLAWIPLVALTMFPFLAVFGRFERSPLPRSAASVPSWRMVVGALVVCLAIAFLALGGIGDGGVVGVRVPVLVAAFVGAWLSGVIFRRADR